MLTSSKETGMKYIAVLKEKEELQETAKTYEKKLQSIINEHSKKNKSYKRGFSLSKQKSMFNNGRTSMMSSHLSRYASNNNTNNKLKNPYSFPCKKKYKAYPLVKLFNIFNMKSDKFIELNECPAKIKKIELGKFINENFEKLSKLLIDKIVVKKSAIHNI